MVKKAPCTLACTATLAEMKPETFWRKIGNKSYQPWFPKGSKTKIQTYHIQMWRVRGVKKRRKSILTPRLLRLRFAFSCLLLSLLPLCLFRLPPFPDPAPPASAHRFCRPPDIFLFCFCLFFAPLSLHQNRVSGAKSIPVTFEYNGSRGFLEPLVIQGCKF